MQMRRFIAPLIALAGMLLSAQVSKAAQTTFAGATANGSTAFTYTTGSAGGLTIAAASTFTGLYTLPPGSADLNATLAFTGLANSGVVTGTTPNFTQALTGGTFTLTSASSVVLLSGSFTGASLQAITPPANSQANFLTTVLGVTYSGGTYFAASGLQNPGGFSFGLTSVNPTVTVLGTGYFNSFAAGGSGTFSAATPTPPVPEPMTAAAGLMGLPVLALWALKRKQVKA
jgi:hypothetical protein